MAINIRTAVTHYGFVDMRIRERSESIVRHLAPMMATYPELADKTGTLAKNLFMFASELSPLLGGRGLRGRDDNKDLYGPMDYLYYVLSEMQEPEQVVQTIDNCNKILGRRLHNLGIDPNQLDLDRLKDTILIASLAFTNYCRLACGHCGNAGKWDNRHHSLDDFIEMLPKIRFPNSSRVCLSYHEPFTLPFLMDVVEILFQRAAGFSIVTSLLGITPTHRDYILRGLRYFYDKNPRKVAVALSFDLFRRVEIDEHMKVISWALNEFPFIKSIKFGCFPGREEERTYYLRRLLHMVSSSWGRALVEGSLEGQTEEGKEISPVGMALAHDGPLAGDSLFALPYAHKYDDRLSPEVRSFMLFPGGWIAPDCSFVSSYYQSLGNLRQQAPSEIFERLLVFDRDYNERLQAKERPLSALIHVERSRRKTLGIGDPLITDYDVLARIFIKKDLEALAKGQNPRWDHLGNILLWVDSGLASLKGIRVPLKALAALYKPFLVGGQLKQELQEKNPLLFEAQNQAKMFVKYGIASYEELDITEEELS